MFLKNRLYIFIFLCIVNIILLFDIEGNKSILFRLLSGSSNVIKISVAELFQFGSNMSILFTSRNEIMKENNRLQKEILEYRKQLKSIDVLVFENQKMRQLLQFSYSLEYDIIPANIITSSSGEGSNQFIVDRGREDGIGENFIACAIYGNKLVLLGKVIISNQNTAIIQNIQEYNFSMPVITSNSQQRGILTGQGINKKYLTLVFDSLYLTKNVFVGEDIYIYEYSKTFPRGIPIGIISHLNVNEKDSMISAEITPYVSYDMLDMIVLLVPKKDSYGSDTYERQTSDTAKEEGDEEIIEEAGNL